MGRNSSLARRLSGGVVLPSAEAKAKLEFVFLDRIEDAIRTAIGELPAQTQINGDRPHFSHL